MEWIGLTIFLMLLKAHYTPWLSDWVVFAPITLYVVMIVLAMGLNILAAFLEWSGKRKRERRLREVE